MSQHARAANRHVETLRPLKKKKEEILGKMLVASQRARHFLLWQMWFLSLKKVWKECDYDESLQFACDTEGRMNGHVKSMCFLHLMESAAGRCDYRHFFYSNMRNYSTLLHLFFSLSFYSGRFWQFIARAAWNWLKFQLELYSFSTYHVNMRSRWLKDNRWHLKLELEINVWSDTAADFWGSFRALCAKSGIYFYPSCLRLVALRWSSPHCGDAG